MSLAPSHDQSLPALSSSAEVEARSALAEKAVAIGFLSTVSVAMIGWLYVLAVAAWNGVIWLFS